MESLVLTIDLAALLALLVFSLRNERRPSGTAETGPFWIKEAPVLAKSETAVVRPNGIRMRRSAPRL